MVFSSPEFLLAYLPVVVLGYYALLRLGQARFIAPYIFLVSLFYYGWWRPLNLWIICASILGNYWLGQKMGRMENSRALLVLGASANLLLLGIYKYTDFCISSINSLAGTQIPLQGILLPIGISFFTFQQIAYLADIHSGRHNASKEGFAEYCCFVCFFPQLIAGPIVHHAEMMPQFFESRNHVPNWENIFNGLFILSLGLAKKILLADSLSPMVRSCFDLQSSLTFCEASFASLAYSMQLYFDFSGYSDMAVGLALLFNIHLPWNFDSPYKATDIQDFWRRWHITLSRWLREYLYIPLGGNRKGTGRTFCNLFLTFLLGGLWHGAAWTFIIWGAMHGCALVVHRVWSKHLGRCLPAVVGWLVTFIFVNLSFVAFRAANFERLEKFIDAFLGYNDFWARPGFVDGLAEHANLPTAWHVAVIMLVAFGICLFGPNVRQLLVVKSDRRVWITAILFVVSLVILFAPATPEFIYSKF